MMVKIVQGISDFFGYRFGVDFGLVRHIDRREGRQEVAGRNAITENCSLSAVLEIERFHELNVVLP